MAPRGRLPRAILIYLAAIVAPALVLLYLGLQSLDRRHEAVRSLELSNRRMSEERLAAELERRIRRAVEGCLESPGDSCRPTAQHRFLIENGEVLSPRLRTPPLRNPEGLSEVFRQAEDQELRQGRIDDALAAYERAAEAAGPAAANALALARMARCRARLGRTEAARTT